ncbi:biomineralization proteins SpP19L long form isoform X2 [Strongylocentrotus purpuratus]|uniref:Uncharacterized protein n=1 Tax=Strongylocentrotus purpuratus TaxID=7668 RepID=Q8MUL4_STRPU|nr:biomineralization proteins SpP19L long form [Strongylocentrotus purpuratus]XP_011661512.1 biomineralization proteins SpP19L long form isoform X2 [Strongylocentrotus purpuratus]XP_030836028.1 biomineralization proteins SpP19L long form isoform X2 [Strongylocentrotus purpuratus]AAM70483.1 19 kD predicted protein product, short form [Strongylocentrotus purpuratus]|eukprot:NP_999812.1 biomineralization proteins SpP19L long form [Strongylocentrotus purpuratus]
MTKEEAATEETKTETKLEAAPEAPPKTEPESKIEEGQASGEGAGEEGKDGESKPEGKTSSTSTRKKKWLPWQRREGNSVKGASIGAEPANSSEERQPTEAEMDAELQKRIQDLQQEKSKIQDRLQLYRKINDLEKEVGDMKGELDTLKVCVARPEEIDTKVPDEGQ